MIALSKSALSIAAVGESSCCHSQPVTVTVTVVCAVEAPRHGDQNVIALSEQAASSKSSPSYFPRRVPTGGAIPP